MVNGSLVQFTLYYLQLRVLLSVTYGCMCNWKKDLVKKVLVGSTTSRYSTIIPFIYAKLLNARCELKLPPKNYIEPRLVLKHVSYICTTKNPKI